MSAARAARRAWVGALRVAAFACLFTSACGSKEDATLSVFTQNAVLSKDASPFGSKLDGSVDLVLDMGNYSSGSVTVDGATLRLFRGANAQILARATIVAAAGSPTFPLQIAAKAKQSISYTISIDQLTADEITELCAGPITVSGSVDQEGAPSLTIGATPVTAAGCP